MAAETQEMIGERLAELGERREHHRTEAVADTQRIAELVPQALEAGLSKTEICRLARISWPTLESILRQET